MNKYLKENWLLVLFVSVLAIAVFVWPTRYKYIDIHGFNRDCIARVDRFSGQVQLWGIWYNINDDRPNMRWK